MTAAARDWNAAGLPTPAPTIGVRDPDNPAGPRIGAGEPSAWTPNTVRGVLTNPRYAGLRAHGSLPKTGQRKITVMGAAVWPALVSDETWRAAVELLGDPARRTAPKSGRPLLSGLALCGWADPATGEQCGSTVHGGRNPQGQRTHLADPPRRQWRPSTPSPASQQSDKRTPAEYAAGRA